MNQFSVSSLIVFLSLAGIALAQIPRLGKCPDFPAVKPFDVEKYQGVWYELQRSFAAFEIGAKCVKATYTLNETDSSIEVVNESIKPSGATKIVGKAVQVDAENRPAKLSVSFPGFPGNGAYEVVATDYKNYAVVFGCHNMFWEKVRREILWILVRERNGAGVDLEKVYGQIEAAGINRSALMVTDQTDCKN